MKTTMSGCPIGVWPPSGDPLALGGVASPGAVVVVA
jgi:hypothetical protein